jgi:adenylosuccinate synthase
MKQGKFNVIIDAFWGSSGKGKVSAWLVDYFGVKNISSSNFPNAGHTFQFGEYKFVAKAIPTALALKHAKGMGVKGWLSPASGLSVSDQMKWDRLIVEWAQSGKPDLIIHNRASIVTPEHAQAERDGTGSTKHIASTMQGCSAAMIDKILRKNECLLAGSKSVGEWTPNSVILPNGLSLSESDIEEFVTRTMMLDSMHFRISVQSLIKGGNMWLHEGSQGYALSIDHGSSYPHCTSRNCTLQKAMDDMAVPPDMVGDVYLNLRTHPIRVGNVIEDGVQHGYSGDFYPDCKELTWEQIAEESGMPDDEAKALTERERTTVTKRVRRVCSFSFVGLEDAVVTNGATKLILNFVQYLDWNDYGLRGDKKAFNKLSKKTRSMIDKIEQVANVPVVLIGTGADHEDMITLM